MCSMTRAISARLLFTNHPGAPAKTGRPRASAPSLPSRKAAASVARPARRRSSSLTRGPRCDWSLHTASDDHPACGRRFVPMPRLRFDRVRWRRFAARLERTRPRTPGRREACLAAAESRRRTRTGHPGLAYATYLEGLYSTLFVTRLARGVGVLEVSEAVRAGPPPPLQVWKACGMYSPDGGFCDAVNPTTGSVGHGGWSSIGR